MLSLSLGPMLSFAVGVRGGIVGAACFFFSLAKINRDAYHFGSTRARVATAELANLVSCVKVILCFTKFSCCRRAEPKR